MTLMARPSDQTSTSFAVQSVLAAVVLARTVTDSGPVASTSDVRRSLV
jgi:hypothetical protein